MTCEGTRRMHSFRTLALAALALAIAACQPQSQHSTSGALRSEPWHLPAPVGATLADLSTTPSGELLLSWTQQAGHDMQVLMLSRFTAGHWTTPVMVVRADWFGNAMDPPHVRMTADGTLWAQWLRRNAHGAMHARDVVLSRSLDGGKSWSAAVDVNTDGTATEHGFSALWPASRDRLGIAWLDGRATVASGSTMLRAATFDVHLDRSDESVVDASTCDCCRTNVSMTASGPILAYRGRTAGEIRDIMVTRLDGGRWSTPVNVHADGWILKGCPMNGPAISANNHQVAVAWYSSANDVPVLRVAWSHDGGQRFGVPVELSRNPRLQGRVDAILASDGTWVSWLDDESGIPALKLAYIGSGDSHSAPAALTLQRFTAPGRAIGYSRIAALDGKLYALWSDASAGQATLAGAVVSRGE